MGKSHKEWQEAVGHRPPQDRQDQKPRLCRDEPLLEKERYKNQGVPYRMLYNDHEPNKHHHFRHALKSHSSRNHLVVWYKHCAQGPFCF